MSEGFTETSIRVPKELSDSIKATTSQLVNHLIEKWDEMYSFSHTDKLIRLNKIGEYYESFAEDILQSVEEKRLNMIENLKKKSDEYRLLKKNLMMNGEEIQMRTPYTKFLEDMDKKIEELLSEKENRLAKAEKLRLEEKELCLKLGMSPLPPFANPVPTEENLDELRLRLFELHETKINRIGRFKEIKARIIDLNKVLEREPENKFENEIHNMNEQNFQPSTVNMDKLEDLKDMLEKLYNEELKRKEYLLEKLKKLWSQLKINIEDREIFLARYDTVNKSHVQAIEAEISRCEKIKRENMKQIIESMREQISCLWDKLTYTEEQRAEFTPYLTCHFSEDIADLHELEVERLTVLYETNKHILDLAEEWEELCERYLILEKRAADKNRLFDNRGGKLLKEEKERKELETNLRKVDKQLISFIEELHCPLLWHGKDLLTQIMEEKERRSFGKLHSTYNNTPRNYKKINNGNPLETDSDIGRSALKRAALTPSGGSTVKMRRCDFIESSTTPKVATNVISRSCENLQVGCSSSMLVESSRNPQIQNPHKQIANLLSVPGQLANNVIEEKKSLERSGQYSRSCMLLTYIGNSQASNPSFKQEDTENINPSGSLSKKAPH